MMKRTSQLGTKITQCGLKSQYRTAECTYTYLRYPDQQIHPLHPNQGVPATPTPQPDQIELSLDHGLMELDILEDTQGLIDVLDKVISDFDAWV